MDQTYLAEKEKALNNQGFIYLQLAERVGFEPPEPRVFIEFQQIVYQKLTVRMF
jgi:hypothetical protein